MLRLVVKSKKCIICGREFQPMKITKVCNYVCALKYNEQKVVLKQQKADKELIRAFKTNIKTLAEYKKDLQTNINKIVRLLDKGHPCISSGRSNYTVHAGHFYSVGANENLRFNLLNIWAQSDSDNTHKSGNELMFRKGLISTFGIELINEIDNSLSSFGVSDAEQTINAVKQNVFRTNRNSSTSSVNAPIEEIKLQNIFNAKKDLP